MLKKLDGNNRGETQSQFNFFDVGIFLQSHAPLKLNQMKPIIYKGLDKTHI